jgi:hypothetical protein
VGSGSLDRCRDGSIGKWFIYDRMVKECVITI